MYPRHKFKAIIRNELHKTLERVFKFPKFIQGSINYSHSSNVYAFGDTEYFTNVQRFISSRMEHEVAYTKQNPLCSERSRGELIDT